MSGYTIRNLKDVEDAAPKFGMSPALEARFAREALELESSGVSYQRLAPDERIPFGHRHEQQEELYVVVGGGGRIKLNEDVVLRQWDAVRIGPETMRCVEAGRTASSSSPTEPRTPAAATSRWCPAGGATDDDPQALGGHEDAHLAHATARCGSG
jgi:hypothetical protein